MRKQIKRGRRQSGFTLIEVMVAIVVLLAGVIGVAQLVPAAAYLNGQNRADSSSMVYAQREMDEFIDQGMSTAASFTDEQGNTCNLGSTATFNTAVGNPLTTLNGHVAIDFSGSQVSGYGYYYTDPSDTTNAIYDVRWAIITNGPASGTITSRRIILGVKKKSGDTPLQPVTLDSTVYR